MLFEKSLKIVNKLGLHARAAARFVKTAHRFSSEIFVTKDGSTVNGKSILGILTLAASCNSIIKVSCQGPDAMDALSALEQLVLSKFEEE